MIEQPFVLEGDKSLLEDMLESNLPAIPDDLDRGQRGLYLKLHSAAIHIEHVMSLVARKGWLYLLYHAYPRLQSEETHQISLKELKENIGIDSTHNNKHIIEAMMSLRRAEVSFNIFGKDGRKWKGNSSLLSEFRISEDKDGLLVYAFPPFLRERLFNPTIYTQLSLAISRKFKSKHSLAIYMMAVDYIFKDRNEGSKRLKIDELRLFLGLKDSQYRLGGDLVRLMQSVEEEINQDSDIDITITPEKEGRKISGFMYRMAFKADARAEKVLLPFVPVNEAEPEPEALEALAASFAELDEFALQHHISLQNKALKKLLNGLAETFSAEAFQGYIKLIIKDIQRRLKLPNQDGIQDVARIFVHYLKEQVLLEQFTRALEQDQKKSQHSQLELQQALDKELRSLYAKQNAEAFKSYVAAQVDAGTLSAESFEEQAKKALPTHLLKTYLHRFQGRLTPSLLVEAPLSVQELLKRGVTFGYELLDEPTWKQQYLQTESGKELVARLEATLPTKSELPF